MYGFDPYIRTMYGPDIPYNPYIVATLRIYKRRLFIHKEGKNLKESHRDYSMH